MMDLPGLFDNLLMPTIDTYSYSYSTLRALYDVYYFNK